MKILIISHNVLCDTASMGKTLLSYFGDWKSEDLAQFYIHSEVPIHKKCKNYYRITDSDVLASIFKRRSGTIFREADIDENRGFSRTDTGLVGNIYQKSRQRTPLIYFARNLIWKLGKWNTKKLRDWVDDFAPEAVFFASGDYAFMYEVALYIAQRKKIPLFVCCMDDYYFNNKNEHRFGGKLAHKVFMKQVKKTMAYADSLYCICDKMSREYSKLFGCPSYTLHTASSFDGPLSAEKTNKISYIGNLGFQRNQQLVALGQALKKADYTGKPDMIDVYSAEKRPEVLQHLTEKNGIRFHGEIDSDRVREVMAESLLLIHTESFDEEIRRSVAYSVSTKIADSLASGTCLVAYGPAEIASIQYLRENHVAFCITDANELETGLAEILSKASLRDKIIRNAMVLAKHNHRGQSVSKRLRQDMQRYL